MTVAERTRDTFDKYPGLRILFLFDRDGVYREEIDAWDEETTGILCIAAEPGVFSTKYRLEKDLTDRQVLLYTQATRPEGEALEEYHLADLLFANRELLLDPVADFMEEFGIERRHMRLIERYYQAELRLKNRQAVLAPLLRSGDLDEADLKRGLASFHLGFRMVKSWNEVIAGVMARALDRDAFEKFLQKCDELELTDQLGRRLRNLFQLSVAPLGYETVAVAAQKLKYNLLMRTVEISSNADTYADLRLHGSVALNAFSTFVAEWQGDLDLAGTLPDVLGRLASDVREEQLLLAYGADARFGITTPVIERAILDRATTLVDHQPERALQIVNELMQTTETESPEATVLLHIASYYRERGRIASFSYGTPQEFIEAYIRGLYGCDLHYRKGVLAYQQLQQSSGDAGEQLAATYQKFLGHYHDSFIKPLNVEWLGRLRERAFDLRSLGVPLQDGFYRRHVESVDQKMAVIISDGLRYELARELADDLVKDPRKSIEIEGVLASVPSVTALGMANLLPHTAVEFTNGEYCIDGKSSAGTLARSAILREHLPESIAITYEQAESMDVTAGRQLFKDHRLVYIYHNHIDAVGDDRATERRTTQAAADTLRELDALVRKLNNWNVYRVVITADHGFLYMDDPVPEAMKETFPEATGEVMRKPRYVLAEEFAQATAGYVMPLRSVSAIDSDLKVCVPKAVNRYRLSGSGDRYAHGGASLQELVVPELVVLKAREEKVERVTIRLLTTSNTISTGVLIVELLQKEAVSSARKGRRVNVALYSDQKEMVSDEAEVLFESTSSDPTLRKQSVPLTLNAKASQVGSCNLFVFDEEDRNRLNPLVNQRFTIKRLIEHDEF